MINKITHPYPREQNVSNPVHEITKHIQGRYSRTYAVYALAWRHGIGAH